MAYKDLREWLAQIEQYGELRRIDGVPLYEELGAVHELAHTKKNVAAILFDNIPGYPEGYRIACTVPSARSTALTLNLQLSQGASVLEMTQKLREKLGDVGRIPPKVVKTGPVLENTYFDDDVDLMKFPVPKWHELDGGEFMGTGDLVITRDPDDGWINAGTYRVQRHDKNTLGFFISPGKHGRIHREKYFAKGQPCPVAVSFGHDPLMVAVGSSVFPSGFSEYEYAGGMRGEPVEVIHGPVTGLPIPAHSELAIEGYSYPDEVRPEGPFGEFTGYYASGERDEPVIHVKSVMHRNNPIILGMPPLKPRTAAEVQIKRAATVWNGLERAGIPDIVGVGCYITFFITVVSIHQRYPGHSRQVGAIASQIPGGAYCGRWTIVVDEDIDPTDMDEVLWALATRCDPALSFDFLHRCLSTPLDPMSNKGLTPDGLRMFNSRVIVDACIPYELKTRNLFPPVVGASPGLLAKVKAKYEAFLD
ncbi:MAG: UbiD family decarboxylase [Desulfobacterales bacterium]|nr:UbiD family decarboxylase [Desulfobacterales bacterium]